MSNSTQQRFTPPSSDGVAERATSPALSASSRTTTSLPTDLSDVSSISDGDYEVVDPPDEELALGDLHRNALREYDSDAEDDVDNDLQRYRRTSASSRGDLGSSSHFLDSEASSIVFVPQNGHESDSLAGSFEDQQAPQRDASPVRTSSVSPERRSLESSSVLLTGSRNSIDTVQRVAPEGADWNADSCSSSQLRFPDPLESTYSQDAAADGQASTAVQQTEPSVEVQGEDAKSAEIAEDKIEDTKEEAQPQEKAADVIAPRNGKDHSVQALLSHLRDLFSPVYTNATLMRHGWRVGVAVLALAMASSTYRHWMPATSVGPVMTHHTPSGMLSASVGKSIVQKYDAPATKLAPVQKPFESTRSGKAVAVVSKSTKEVGTSRVPFDLAKLTGLQNKTITAAEKGSRELSTYLAGSSASAANWITADVLTMIQPCSDIADHHARILKKKAHRRLRKSSRNAKSLMIAVQKDVAILATTVNTRYQYNVKPHGLALRRGSMHTFSRSKELLRMFSSASEDRFSSFAVVLRRWTTALMKTLQKAWIIWLKELQRAYALFKRDVKAERARVKADLEAAWHRASDFAASSSKHAQDLWNSAQTQTSSALRTTREQFDAFASSMCDDKCSARSQKQMARRMRELEILRRRHRALMHQIHAQAKQREQQTSAKAKLAAGKTLKALSSLQVAVQHTFEDAKTSLQKSTVQAGRARVRFNQAVSSINLCPSLKQDKAAKACAAASDRLRASMLHGKRAYASARDTFDSRHDRRQPQGKRKAKQTRRAAAVRAH